MDKARFREIVEGVADKLGHSDTKRLSGAIAYNHEIEDLFSEPPTQCGFHTEWVGHCTKDKQTCKKHKGLVCSSCGAPATRECGETMGLVCGTPLCDDCEHTIQSNGCNSRGTLPHGYNNHCKKDAQVYKSWFEDGAKEYNAAMKLKTTQTVLPKIPEEV